MAKPAKPRLPLAAFRGRLIFRGAFLLLVIATLSLALVLLKEEKRRSYQNYRVSLTKTQAEIAARLRHPAGQLALLNPAMRASGVVPLRPLVLPFSALDFDDQNKVQQAIEMAGCLLQYPDGSSACAAVGSNPYAGGFLYLAGSFLSGPLVGRERGVLELDNVHYARISVTSRGETTQWTAPFEAQVPPGPAVATVLGPPAPALPAAIRGRLTGFAGGGPMLIKHSRPVRDFRGWLWQSPRCADPAIDNEDCTRRSFFSIRLPVEVFREALFAGPRPVWPPPELDGMQVRIEMFGPKSGEGDAPVLFDSNAGTPTPPFSLGDLTTALQPGETLRIRKLGAGARDIALLSGAADTGERTARWISRLVDRIEVPGAPASSGSIEERNIISTAAGNYEVALSGDLRGMDRGIAAVATRLSTFVAAMLAAIILAWLVIELGLIRRIAVLTRRAAAVSRNVQQSNAQGKTGADRITELEVADLRGSDELGILAGGLSDLLERVKDDVRREQIRAQQERELWHAVGHEIMSPLQSLMVLHPKEEDASHRYIQRMQQAVRVLYGTASPSEALQAATLRVEALDLNAFLANLAANAHFAGVADVRYEAGETPVPVRADEFPLEDVVTHILRNADRHRTAGTAITLSLEAGDGTASVAIRNVGPRIDTALLERIFEYGVSDAQAGNAHASERRGQGLFVAKTYMAKMGGTVSARNESDGASFILTLQRAA